MPKTKGNFRTLLGLLLVMLAVLAGCQKEPDTPEDYIALGRQYLQEQNYEEALMAFNDAIELDPGKAEAYASRAQANEVLDNREDALADYEKAVELDPAREAELTPSIDALREDLRSKTYAEANRLTFSPAADFTTSSVYYPDDMSDYVAFETPVTIDGVTLTDNGDGTLTADVTTTMHGQREEKAGYTSFTSLAMEPWDEYTGHTVPTSWGNVDLLGNGSSSTESDSAPRDVCVIEWQGKSYEMSAVQDERVQWQDDGSAYVTCTIHVTYPQGYDGLAFACLSVSEISPALMDAYDALEESYCLLEDPLWNSDAHLFRFRDLLAAFG